MSRAARLAAAAALVAACARQPQPEPTIAQPYGAPPVPQELDAGVAEPEDDREIGPTQDAPENDHEIGPTKEDLDGGGATSDRPPENMVQPYGAPPHRGDVKPPDGVNADEGNRNTPDRNAVPRPPYGAPVKRDAPFD